MVTLSGVVDVDINLLSRNLTQQTKIIPFDIVINDEAELGCLTQSRIQTFLCSISFILILMAP